MYQSKKLGVVIPAYNEGQLILETLQGMPHSADRIYVVDDGSTDATGQIARDFKDERFYIISNGQNRGVGKTITTGYKQALEDNMDIVVVMAGDNQMDPTRLAELLDPIIKGEADYAKGNRLSRYEHRVGMSKWRFFGNWLLTILTKIASGYWKMQDSQNGYTAITREALTRIDLNQAYPGYGYCNDLLVKLNVAGLRVIDVPMPARYGREKSKIRYRRYLIKVSLLLLRIFLWRLRMKYLTPILRR